MMRTIADELYSESLKLVNVNLDSGSPAIADGDHPHGNTIILPVGNPNRSADDNDLWDASDEIAETSDLDREWRNRREEFQNIGYRDGIIAGKEASAQEGFNLGLKESLSAGYQWGLVRGVTSALALLPDEMKAKLMETDVKITQLQRLYESTSSVSTSVALKSFHDDLLLNKTLESTNETPASPTSAGLLGNYFQELSSHFKESPTINIQPLIDP